MGNGTGGSNGNRGPGAGEGGRAATTTIDAYGTVPGVFAAPLAQQTEKGALTYEYGPTDLGDIVTGVAATPRPGTGSTFRLQLPRLRA